MEKETDNPILSESAIDGNSLSKAEPAVTKDEKTDAITKFKDNNKYTLYIKNLSFLPSPQLVLTTLEKIRYYLTMLNLSWLMLSYKGPSRKNLLSGAELCSIDVQCNNNELVILIGDAAERYELIQLIVGRKKSGKFDGNIYLYGDSIDTSNYYDNIAYVTQVTI